MRFVCGSVVVRACGRGDVESVGVGVFVWGVGVWVCWVSVFFLFFNVFICNYFVY